MINRMFLVFALVAGLGLATAAPAALADRTAELTFEDGLLLDPGQAGAAPGIAGQWKNRLGADRVRIQAFWNALSPDRNHSKFYEGLQADGLVFHNQRFEDFEFRRPFE